MEPLKGKVVLITGATSGIGRALALKCAGEGAHLAVCGRDRGKMASLLADLAGMEGAEERKVYAETFSARETEAIRTFVRNAESALGRVRILINNAGLNSAKGEVEDIRLEDWEEMMAVNVRAPLVFTQEVLKSMKQAREGIIANILSSVCFFHSPGMASYTASKSACQAFTGVLRKEAAPFGIKVMGVFPGGVDTPFRPQSRPDYMRAESVAESMIHALQASPDVVIHELVMRPLVETNYP